MLIVLLSAVLKDVMSVTRTEEFFTLSSVKREKQIDDQLGKLYPNTLRAYLTQVSAESFVIDVQAVLPALISSRGVPGHLVNSIPPSSFEAYPFDLPNIPKRSSQQEDPVGGQWSEEFLSDMHAVLQEIVREPAEERRPNAFVKAFAAFLSSELADALDQEESKKERLGTYASSVVQHIFQTKCVIDFGREVQHFLQEQIGVASPVIQSPQPLSTEQKQDMRTRLRERYPGSFPLFEVESSLGGGLRLFYQGEMFDESWITHVARLFTRLRVD